MLKQNEHPNIVASFNAQSLNGSDMSCKPSEISTFMNDYGVGLSLLLKHGDSR